MTLPEQSHEAEVADTLRLESPRLCFAVKAVPSTVPPSLAARIVS